MLVDYTSDEIEKRRIQELCSSKGIDKGLDEKFY